MTPRSPHRTLALVVMTALALTACRGKTEAPSGTLSISVEQHSAWVRNFNPLSPGEVRWPTRAGIHEPLLIFNTLSGDWTPWLAVKHRWSEDLLTLTFRLRPDVRWSDGEAFDAEDVLFTFELLREHPALDLRSVWKLVEGVRALDDHTVEFKLVRAYVPGLADIAGQPMIPEHVWSEVDDPVTFTNPDPVGTGPFTEVERFQNQIFELGRNPYYWQGLPEVERLRFLALPSNDQANLALVDGSVDWAGNFVPVVDRTFVDRDPEHHRYWFPQLGAMIFLYANTQQAPFDDPRVRRALSMAIDRERLVHVAMYDYTVPAHPSALSDAYAGWRGDGAGGEWVGFDVAAANSLLDDAGCRRGEDGVRLAPNGEPMVFDIEVVNGWSDWVRAGQVISQSLDAIGVKATLRPREFSAWFSRLQRGEFQLAISWSVDGDTPYHVYRWLLSSKTVKPLGELATGNWHRFGDARSDELLTAFEATADPAEQYRIIDELQARFIELAPAIPLFANPLWSAYSTRAFEGFPSAEDPYAKPSPYSEPECLLVLTRLKPRGR